MNRSTHVFNTPLGPMRAVFDAQAALVELGFHDAQNIDNASKIERPAALFVAPTDDQRAACQRLQAQVEEYCCGARQTFTVSLASYGTAFQRLVWAELQRIPYGQTASYGEIARRLGSPNASRAVGRANATNPIMILVPCHRVIGAGGKLTGYAGGLPAKSRLLQLERQFLTNSDE